MSRNIVYKTLEFDKPERAPRDLWALPWANYNYPDQLEKIRNKLKRQDLSDFNPIGQSFSVDKEFFQTHG